MVAFFQENKKVYLACECGLGKTRTVLEAIEHGPTLVVGPLRVVQTVWEAESEKWGYGFTFSRILGSVKQRKAGLAAIAEVYLVNVENLLWLRQQYTDKTWPFKTVIFDESSLYKSPGAKRTRAAQWIGKQAEYVALLSGTPAPNSLLDLYAQVKILDGGVRLGRSMQAYKNRYFYPTDWKQYNWEVKPGYEPQIYNKIDDIFTSLKAEDYLELPELIVNPVHVNINLTGYNKLVKKMHLEIGDETIDAESAAVLVGKLAQYASGAIYVDEEHNWEELHKAKLDAMEELLESTDGPVLVVYNYRHSLQRIIGHFGAAVTDEHTVQRWNERKVPLMALHMNAGHGLNLQSAGHTVIWYDATWSSESWIQTNARLHRQGQKHPVIVHQLIAKGTIDEEMGDRVGEKINVQNLLLRALK